MNKLGEATLSFHELRTEATSNGQELTPEENPFQTFEFIFWRHSVERESRQDTVVDYDEDLLSDSEERMSERSSAKAASEGDSDEERDIPRRSNRVRINNARARRIIRMPTPVLTPRRRGRPPKVLGPHARNRAITPAAAVPERPANHSTPCATAKEAPLQSEKESNCNQGSHRLGVTYGARNKVDLISRSDDYCQSNQVKLEGTKATKATVTWRDVVIHRANRAGPTHQPRPVDSLEEGRINNRIPQKQNDRPAQPERPVTVPIQVGNNLNGAIEQHLQDLGKLKSRKSELEIALARKQMEVRVYEEELRRFVMKEKEMDRALEAVFSG
ncbi:hypothetical protein M422DRAFT_238996 [Sphaerobolus stellatus SS14]|nr:hypothetical protein M422DRAFT_238996 [Sphaerobolus stellatus SS14]